jgi:hypothetical protein
MTPNEELRRMRRLSYIAALKVQKLEVEQEEQDPLVRDGALARISGQLNFYEAQEAAEARGGAS